MRRQVKSCRPHLIPACCIAASRESRSGASGRKAVLMPKGESTSNASGAAGDESVMEKLLLAVGREAAGKRVALSNRTSANRCIDSALLPADAKGVFELRPVALRHRMALHAVAGRPLILREIKGAEQPVED